MTDPIIYPTYVTALGEIREQHECRFAGCPGGENCPGRAMQSVIPCRTLGCEATALPGGLYCDQCAGELSAEPLTVAEASGWTAVVHWIRDHFSGAPQNSDLFAQYLRANHYGMTQRQFDRLPKEARLEIICAFRDCMTLTQGEPSRLFEEEEDNTEGSCAISIACVIAMVAAVYFVLVARSG